MDTGSAMETYEEYLFDEVVLNQKIVTYRLLSRHLKIHAQLAKEMLYNFYITQNKKHPNSVHTTYLLTGVLRPSPPSPKPTALEAPKQDEDTIMASSPFDTAPQAQPQSHPDGKNEIPLMRTVIVVPQEKLEGSKKKFERLSAIHVYSVESAPLSDLSSISTTGNTVWLEYSEIAPKDMRKYGCVVNPEAKKKSGSHIIPTAAPSLPSLRVDSKIKSTPPSSTTSKTSKSSAATSFFGKKKSTTKTEDTIKKEESTQEEPAPVKEQKLKAEPMKRTASGSGQTSRTSSQKNFMSNWQAASKKQDKKAAAQKLDTDSEGEVEEEEPVMSSKDAAEIARKKAEQRAALEAMMDDDDDDEFSTIQPPGSATVNEPMKDPTPPPAQEPEPETSTPSVAPSTASTEASTSQPAARRRAKRKVMKKRQFKDEDGYLVTREEAVWESYSEDEPEPSSKHRRIVAIKASPKTETDTDEGEDGKKKKAGAKKKGGQQGNIMSFFQKK
ncbi:hypothetical protein EX30DRAFT_337272 [Ascodesmis nigricans]|uniref:DNA polymerase delta subunit 3 n=1 Tax=Ascodesmis nigricans TaxID=341454 RepID=A0A4S2N6S3_9PEZI|nr:hypothetical protein EX30DRAFT_337272 [Ascodesmis nigricans]